MDTSSYISWFCDHVQKWTSQIRQFDGYQWGHWTTEPRPALRSLGMLYTFVYQQAYSITIQEN